MAVVWMAERLQARLEEDLVKPQFHEVMNHLLKARPEDYLRGKDPCYVLMTTTNQFMCIGGCGWTDDPRSGRGRCSPTWPNPRWNAR